MWNQETQPIKTISSCVITHHLQTALFAGPISPQGHDVCDSALPRKLATRSKTRTHRSSVMQKLAGMSEDI